MSQQLFSEIASKAPIVPVLVVEDLAHAAPLAEALQAGGAIAIEVTLRTAGALDCIKDMKSACPSLAVGAGTVLSEGDVDACIKAGTDFLVTPGTTPALIDAILDSGLPTCPGISTGSEAMRLYDMGFDHQKFFPAGAAGGPGFIKGIGGPLQNISFMPTGGVNMDNLKSYLDLKNVFAVGGSWLAPSDLVKAGKFDEVTDRMRMALRAV